MTIKPNGTIAKDITVHYFKVTDTRHTSAMFGKTINQAKALLKAGYTEEEIIRVINYIVNETDVEMYSLGYVNHSINFILDKLNKEDEENRINQIIKEDKEAFDDIGKNEVVMDAESRERNEQKAKRIGVQSRFGKESFVDLLKE